MSQRVRAFLLCSFIAGAAAAAPPDTPPLPYEAWGALPCEGCFYDEDWKASSAVSALQDRTDNSNVSFRVAKGETVHAETGVVVTSECGRTRVLKALDISCRRYDERGTLSVRPGDVLYTLHYQGEGVYLFWFKGRTYADEILFPGNDDLEIISKPVYVWWVRIRSASGAVGWTKQTRMFIAVPRSE